MHVRLLHLVVVPGCGFKHPHPQLLDYRFWLFDTTLHVIDDMRVALLKDYTYETSLCVS